MPIFDCVCKQCRTKAIDVIAESLAEVRCDACGGEVERLWTATCAPKFEFKSGGFYATDYGTGCTRFH